MARRKFEPTPEQRATVQAVAGYGLPQDEICRLVKNPESGRPIDKKTLVKVFRDELDTGAAMANAKVAESLFKKATGSGQGAVTAAIWWTKCRMGWKETVTHEISEHEAIPIAVNFVRKNAGEKPTS